MRWYNVIVRFIVAAALFSTPPAAAADGLVVSAALSLKAPFEEIARRFEETRGVKVSFNFAASGVLQKQIEHGAPVDVFASASPSETAALDRLGLLVESTRRDFSGNSPVLVVAADSRGRVPGFGELAGKTIERIAIGNPSSVPAGKYAAETLRGLGLYDAVKEKLVFCEHVRQVMDYVIRGEADAGIVFRTDALANARQLRIAAEAPEESHSPVVYSIAVVKGTRQEPAARAFLLFVTSDEGSKVLKRYGFR
ncbi:MAG: molybdate ABC transporter substrate-binding protein [Thermodesulfovibrionales bacterium]